MFWNAVSKKSASLEELSKWQACLHQAAPRPAVLSLCAFPFLGVCVCEGGLLVVHSHIVRARVNLRSVRLSSLPLRQSLLPALSSFASRRRFDTVQVPSPICVSRFSLHVEPGPNTPREDGFGIELRNPAPLGSPFLFLPP